jgi:hypothetical protein
MVDSRNSGASKDVSMELERSPLLEAVTKQRKEDAWKM